ncbi:MAG: DNA-binding protein [Piscinibacter sp.]|uniref:Mor transcription activator family protein n=1 Tax=Piscinibacter sp. TaxID=1903157 RepID=UPI0025890297|nr:Mor transcription activator family protein [Piscinibacter sp.]MCW5666511.1 DNA-binding protein [Piscinibacter sp.]
MNTVVDDPGYPELLADMARVAEKVLRDKGIDEARARSAAVDLAEHLRDYWGGQVLYVPKGGRLETRKRWAEVWDEFRGDNHAELARKHGLGLQQVYKIIEVMKREQFSRTQGKLPFSDS